MKGLGSQQHACRALIVTILYVQIVVCIKDIIDESHQSKNVRVYASLQVHLPSYQSN